ncbi:unnamed protein product, partial [marine sediment metagenome]
MGLQREVKNDAVGNKALHHARPWRTLFSGSSEVGVFR